VGFATGRSPCAGCCRASCPSGACRRESAPWVPILVHFLLLLPPSPPPTFPSLPPAFPSPSPCQCPWVSPERKSKPTQKVHPLLSQWAPRLTHTPTHTPTHRDSRGNVLCILISSPSFPQLPPAPCPCPLAGPHLYPCLCRCLRPLFLPHHSPPSCQDPRSLHPGPGW